MKNAIINNMKNFSDRERFVFTVSCTVCGRVWTSTPVAFSKAGVVPESESKKIVLQALYDKEMEKAALKAVNEAKSHFNLCPVCKSLACDNCFMICDDIDMCTDCAAILQEKGELVEDRIPQTSER